VPDPRRRDEKGKNGWTNKQEPHSLFGKGQEPLAQEDRLRLKARAM